MAAGAPSALAAMPQTNGSRADGLRWQAEARWYEQNRPAASYYTPAALHALGARWQAAARYDAAITGPRSEAATRRTVVASAAGIAVAALVAAGGLLFALGRRTSTVPSERSES
jgi:hypothetical protein